MARIQYENHGPRKDLEVYLKDEKSKAEDALQYLYYARVETSARLF